MKYIKDSKGINVATAKKWLNRNNYSKLAVKVLGRLVKADSSDLSDDTLASSLKISTRSYQEAKRELVYAGFLEVHRLNATTLIYLIGDAAIERSRLKTTTRDNARYTRKALESLGVLPELEEDLLTEVYTEEDMEVLYSKVPQPEPITPIELF